jgi:hypothetical protein
MTLTSTAKADGLIVERPAPLPPGRYEVPWLNARPGAVPAAVLTVDGDKWSLDSGAKLHDVTLITRRSAKYTPGLGRACPRCTPEPTTCQPQHARQGDFPVAPGAAMPAVPGCAKLDYAILLASAVVDPEAPLASTYHPAPAFCRDCSELGWKLSSQWEGVAAQGHPSVCGGDEGPGLSCVSGVDFATAQVRPLCRLPWTVISVHESTVQPLRRRVWRLGRGCARSRKCWVARVPGAGAAATMLAWCGPRARARGTAGCTAAAPTR